MAIYYFTGTGNSLFVASRIGDRMGCLPISIASAMQSVTVRTDADSVVIVFPAYLSALHGVPLIVERFIKKFDNLDEKRLFAVCTCGGYEIVNAVPSLRSLERLVKQMGFKLFAGYTVRLPMNNLDYEHIPVHIETDTEVIIRNAYVQIDEICDRIAHHRRGKYHLFRRFFTALMTPVYLMMAASCMKSIKKLACEPLDTALGFRQLIHHTDKSITVDTCCIGCATCTKVCPVDNIELISAKPVWRHRCEMCFACDEWCPARAIRHWGRANGVKYHHPEVKANDMIIR